MFNLFYQRSPIEVSTIKPQNWTFIQNGFYKNIEKVILFHQLYSQYIKSDHLLVRLIQSLAIPLTLPLNKYYEKVDSVAMNVSMALKLTSSIYKGAFHKGVFYGNDHEIIIANDDYFDINKVTLDWRNADAVEVLYHTYSDLSVLIPDGINYSGKPNLAVISINIAKLAVQYRAFRLANSFDENVQTTSQFIASYVLPNMLKKHCDICFFNRLINKYYGIDNTDVKNYKKHSFTLANYTNYIDQAIDRTLDNLSISNSRMDVSLKQIPSFYNKDIYDTLILPDLTPTMQVVWILFLSRIPYMIFLLDIAKDKNGVNSFYKGQILRDLKLSNTTDVIINSMPSDINKEIFDQLSKLIDLVKD